MACWRGQGKAPKQVYRPRLCKIIAGAVLKMRNNAENVANFSRAVCAFRDWSNGGQGPTIGGAILKGTSRVN
jgi:hypothetical protein